MICALYLVFRVLLHVALLLGWVPGGAEAWQGEDLAINLEAAQRLVARQSLYTVGKMEFPEAYHYSPLYALACVPLTRLPFTATALLHSLMTCVAYLAFYLLWRRIFALWGLSRASASLASLLPLWLIYSAFLGDLSFLNIYTLLCVLATLLIYAIVVEHLPLAVLVAFLILQAKPQWAFALALPLVLGRYRFFWRLIAWTLLAYLGAAGLTSALLGWDYSLSQYRDYYSFLTGMTSNFPWRGPDVSLGYNHSLMQIAYHFFGIRPAVRLTVLALKVALLLPLAWFCLRLMTRRSPQSSGDRELALEGAWALYLGAFLWLDVLWEITLAIALYTYLLAYLESRPARILISVPFVAYALQDVWLVAMYAISTDMLAPSYFWADPTTHIPIIMILLLTLYVVLLARLARRRDHLETSEPTAQSPQYGAC